MSNYVGVAIVAWILIGWVFWFLCGKYWSSPNRRTPIPTFSDPAFYFLLINTGYLGPLSIFILWPFESPKP